MTTDRKDCRLITCSGLLVPREDTKTKSDLYRNIGTSLVVEREMGKQTIMHNNEK